MRKNCREKEALAYMDALWAFGIFPFPPLHPWRRILAAWMHPYLPKKSPTPWTPFEQEKVTGLLPKIISNETPAPTAALENNWVARRGL